jgi:hypothetical protein
MMQSTSDDAITEARKSVHQTQTPLTQRNRIILGPLVKRRTHIMAKTGQGWGKEKSPQWFAVKRFCCGLGDQIWW